jgi:hypothetical protein
MQTLDDLHAWKVSVLAQTDLSFDLSTANNGGAEVQRSLNGAPITFVSATLSRFRSLALFVRLPSGARG